MAFHKIHQEKMEGSALWLLLWLVLLAIGIVWYLLVIFVDPVLNYARPVGDYRATTSSLDNIKRVTLNQTNVIENDKSPFTTYSPDQLAVIRTAVQNATELKQLLPIPVITSNYQVNYRDFCQITTNPAELSYFQFQQGSKGWYWCISQYEVGPDRVFVYWCVNRDDMGGIRANEDAGMFRGQGTFYDLSFGCSINNTYYHAPVIATRGVFEGVSTNAPTQFSLRALDYDNFQLTFTNDSQYAVQCAFDDVNTGTRVAFDLAYEDTLGPAFNTADNGCAPCLGGAGSLYYSFRNLESKGTVTVGATAYDVDGVQGWMDHQWGGTVPSDRLVAIGATLFPPKSVGFGPYLWTVFHVNSKSYMCFAFLSESDRASLGVGSSVKAYLNSYENDKNNSRFLQDADLEIKSVATVEGVVFPKSYEVTVPGIGLVLLDGNVFGGNTVFPDSTNNPHYIGPCTTSLNGVVTGVGYLEGSSLNPPEQVVKNSLTFMGVNPDESSKFYQWSPTPVEKAPAWIAVTAIVHIVVGIIVTGTFFGLEVNKT